MVLWVWSLMTMSMLLMMSPWQWWPGWHEFGSKKITGKKNITGITLPQTNSSHLKMDGGKTIVSFWGFGLF